MPASVKVRISSLSGSTTVTDPTTVFKGDDSSTDRVVSPVNDGSSLMSSTSTEITVSL